MSWDDVKQEFANASTPAEKREAMNKLKASLSEQEKNSHLVSPRKGGQPVSLGNMDEKDFDRVKRVVTGGH
jgi:hypothetical protein